MHVGVLGGCVLQSYNQCGICDSNDLIDVGFVLGVHLLNGHHAPVEGAPYRKQSGDMQRRRLELLSEVYRSFGSLGEVYDYYNMYSWEIIFGIK